MQRAETRPGPFLAVAATILATVGLVWAIVDVDTLAVAAAPALVVGAVIFTRPSLGLVLLAFLLPFEDVLLFAGGATLTKAAGVFVAGVWFAQKLLRRESWRHIVQSPTFLVSVLFIAFAWISALWADWPEVVTPQVVRLVMLVAFAALAFDLVRSWKTLGWVTRMLVAGGIIGASLVILDYVGGGSNRAGEGIAGGINATALLLVVLTPLGFALIRRERNNLWKLAGVAYVLLAVVAVGVTFSRMSYIVMTLILAWELWRILSSPGARIAAALTLVAAVVVGFRSLPLEEVRERAQTILPYVESTLQGGSAFDDRLGTRGFHLRVALEVLGDHPLIGAGYYNFGREFLQYQFQVPGSGGVVYGNPRSAHSSYFAILADLGLLGGTIWLALIGSILWVLWSAFRESGLSARDGRTVLLQAYGVSFLTLLVYGLYAETHKEKLFWLIIGLCLAAGHLARGNAWFAGRKVREQSPSASAGVPSSL